MAIALISPPSPPVFSISIPFRVYPPLSLFHLFFKWQLHSRPGSGTGQRRPHTSAGGSAYGAHGRTYRSHTDELERDLGLCVCLRLRFHSKSIPTSHCTRLSCANGNANWMCSRILHSPPIATPLTSSDHSVSRALVLQSNGCICTTAPPPPPIVLVPCVDCVCVTSILVLFHVFVCTPNQWIDENVSSLGVAHQPGQLSPRQQSRVLDGQRRRQCPLGTQ